MTFARTLILVFKHQIGWIGYLCMACVVTFYLVACKPHTPLQPRHHYTITGQGQPTIVIEAATGQDSKSWRVIQDSLNQYTRVVTYDRLGLGQSDSATTPRDLANLTADLYRFLEAEQITPPFLFVGHGLGGQIVQYYTHQYPDQVVGLLLVDPIHEDHPLPQDSSYTSSRLYLNGTTAVAFEEFKAYDANNELMRHSSLPQNLQIHVIVSLNFSGEGTFDRMLQKREPFLKWQSRMPNVTISTTNVRGRYLHTTDPQLVLSALKTLLKRTEAPKVQ